ncbi:MAG: LCP family protein [Gaiellaceae bacterium]
MRTTLKRGVSRAASTNANGRGVLPPAALTPMTRYRQPLPQRPTGIRLVGQIVLWLLVAVLMLAGAFLGGVYLSLHETVDQAQAKSKDVIAARRNLHVPLPGRTAVGLVIGYDRRKEEPRDGNYRSDTIMLLRADPQQKALSMLSFPRDLQVEVTCPGHTPYIGKINEAYSLCGAPGALATVQKLLKPHGVPVNYLITVNFTGFQEIVDRLGGVWVDVDRRYLNTNQGRTYDTYTEINLWPGYQRLKGWQSLDYVRFRHTDSDVHRTTRQQAFVRAMKQQLGRADLLDLPKIVGSIARNTEVAQGGGREIEPKTVLGWGLFAHDLPAGHFFQSRIEGLEGYSDITTDPANVATAIREFANPDVEAPEDATNVLRGKKLRVPRPEETGVIVLNGNHIEGSAAAAAEALRQRGYRIVLPRPEQTGNAPSFDYHETTIYYNPGYPRAKAAAKVMERLFEPAVMRKLMKIVAPLSNAATLTVVVGKTFHGKIADAPVRKIPERQPPAVQPDDGVSLPHVLRARRKLPFRLMVPTVLALGSSPDVEAPGRVYYLDGKRRRNRTLRLTYQTGMVGEMWGIQQTDWDGAPILQGRNTRQRIAGRTYDLYYTGAKLHMVVLRVGELSYWVVNTLSNQLSNETMLEIAKGLKPLKGPVGRA